MAELADAPDLGSGVLRRAGSSPVIRMQKESEGQKTFVFFFRTHSVLEPEVQGLRFSTVGAGRKKNKKYAPRERWGRGGTEEK